ncbi:MAG TPA: site-2 protease family protein, partial [Patescibacteria group bacterium]|nr:site-2 protease family protein [Patescibacteria group bacterium]
MLSSLFSNPILFLLNIGALLVALTIHEFSHAVVADKLGDPTPRLKGRITLNPIKHLDPFGTLLLLFAGFGWGKPVEYDPYNLRHPRKDSALIALAGPASNILMAVALSFLLRLFPLPDILTAFATFTIHISLVLAVFNFIPIHPLDGGRVLIGFLPEAMAHDWDQVLKRYGIIILFLLIFPFGNSQSPISYLVAP